MATCRNGCADNSVCQVTGASDIRRRDGNTIRSAAAALTGGDRQANLIDVPGRA